MLNIDVKPRTDNKVDIYVADGDNGNDLVNSSQGYENHGDAIHLAHRLFGPDARDEKLAGIRQTLVQALEQDVDRATLITQLRNILDTGPAVEPAELTVHWRNGTTDSKQLR